MLYVGDHLADNPSVESVRIFTLENLKIPVQTSPDPLRVHPDAEYTRKRDKFFATPDGLPFGLPGHQVSVVSAVRTAHWL